ncbi:tyrosine-type recombinase/integrase [Nonomuraea insulae]|uniref:Tyrosine-type recombinase/integrase n=1 Tax=Nonomuraea insulae TaxID=1616787 RepID=A0ABW1CWG8_9ACTN
MPTTAGVLHPHTGGYAPLPALIRQVSSRCRIKGVSHAGSSRTPLHPACRTRAIWQCWPVPALSGLLPPSPASPGSSCPQLHRPAATGSAAKVSHLHSNHCASRRTHDLRHGAASLALQAGADLKVIQDQLGHSSIVLTADTYVTVVPQVARDTAEAVARLLREAGRRPPGSNRPIAVVAPSGSTARPEAVGSVRLLFADALTLASSRPHQRSGPAAISEAGPDQRLCAARDSNPGPAD